MMMNRTCLLINVRSVIGRYSVKKVLLKSLQKFTGKHLSWSPFLKMSQVRPAVLFKKKLWHRLFAGNFVKFFSRPWIWILKGDFRPFIGKKYIFNTCETIENDIVIKQQFRADFRMTPDIFFVALVKNRLE